MLAAFALLAVITHSFVTWVILDSLLDRRGFADPARRPGYNRQIVTQIGLWLVSVSIAFWALHGTPGQVAFPFGLGLLALITAGSSRHASRRRTVTA